MQVVNCTVAIGGEAGMTVAKTNVTVPELLVLRAVHGEDAVRNIEVTGDEDIGSNEERQRLSLLYVNPETVVKDTLGAVGALPKTLDDAGISDEFVISTGPVKGKKGKASATKELTKDQITDSVTQTPAE